MKTASTFLVRKKVKRDRLLCGRSRCYESLHKVEVLRVVGGFCARVADVALGVEPLRYLHGRLGAQTCNNT